MEGKELNNQGKKSKRGLIIILVSFLIICLLCTLSVMALLGRMPGLSSVFAKQKDLGVTHNPEVAYQVLDDLGFEYTLRDNPQAEDALTYSGKIKVKDTFTADEVGSWISMWRKDWVNMPLSNPQFVINDDGSIEGSAMLSMEKVEAFAKELGYSTEDIETGKSYIGLFSGEIPVYAKGSLSINNNELDIKLDSLSAANVPMPGFIKDLFVLFMDDVYKKVQSQAPKLDIQKLEFLDGKLDVEGTFPKRVESK